MKTIRVASHAEIISSIEILGEFAQMLSSKARIFSAVQDLRDAYFSGALDVLDEIGRMPDNHDVAELVSRCRKLVLRRDEIIASQEGRAT